MGSNISSENTNDKITLQMINKFNIVELDVLLKDTFSKVAIKYQMNYECPPGGIYLIYGKRKIQSYETVQSLGLKNGDIIMVDW